MAPEPLLGQVLDGKYQVLERIGSGGMGTVYRALHVNLGAPRAIKVMRRELADDLAFVERFQAEARLAEGLRHASLVALHDFGRLGDGTWYIASDLVDGDTLAALLDRGVRFPSADVAYLLAPLCDGLALAHRRGIVHRDISPDNVMIARSDGDEPLAKLLDFGIAKDLSKGATGRTGPTLLLGKVGYASPEQMGLLGPAQNVDARTDIFSLAVVAYQMLTGILPWRRDDLRTYIHDLIVRPEAAVDADVAARVAEPWRGVFARALARDPERRTPSMPAFKADLAEAARRVADQEGRLPRTSSIATALPAHRTTWRRDRPVPSRMRGAVVLAAGAGLALLAAAGLWRGALPLLPAAARSATPAPTAPVAPRAAADRDARGAHASPAAVSPSSRPSPELAPPLQGPTTAPRPVAQASPQPASQPTSPADPQVPEASQAPGTGPGSEPEAVPSSGPAPVAGVALQSKVREPQVDEGADLEGGSATESTAGPTGFGSLSVAADVWVNVSVDGGPTLQTPAYVGRLSAGTHTVRVWRSGYKEQSVRVDVPAGDTRRLVLTVERDDGRPVSENPR
jgi:serine/threonine-protein kinase